MLQKEHKTAAQRKAKHEELQNPNSHCTTEMIEKWHQKHLCTECFPKSVSSWWFQPSWKILVKMGIFPKDRGENKKCLKPPPRFYLLSAETFAVLKARNPRWLQWQLPLKFSTVHGRWGSWKPGYHEQTVNSHLPRNQFKAEIHLLRKARNTAVELMTLSQMEIFQSTPKHGKIRLICCCCFC